MAERLAARPLSIAAMGKPHSTMFTPMLLSTATCYYAPERSNKNVGCVEIEKILLCTNWLNFDINLSSKIFWWNSIFTEYTEYFFV